MYFVYWHLQDLVVLDHGGGAPQQLSRWVLLVSAWETLYSHLC